MKFAQLSLVLLVACNKDKPADPPAPAPAVVVAPPAAKPGTMNLATVPPLRAADAIEPPSRDIVPGMTIAEALAKGATKDSTDDTTLKKGSLELKIEKESNIVTSFDATYKKKDYDALAAKWGKPNFGERWLGANWVANMNGCDADECVVSFARSPLVLLGATPQPPLGLATLTPKSTVADVHNILGVVYKDHFGFDTGFSLAIGVDENDGRIASLFVTSEKGSDEDVYAAALDKAWGKRVQRNDRNVWFSKDNRWAVETGVDGDAVRYTPIVPAAEEMAQLRALPAKLWLKSKAAVAGAMPDQKEDELAFAPNEWSFGNYSADTMVSVSYNDKGVVDQIHVRISATEQTMKQVTAAFEKAWSKPEKVKNVDGEESMKLTVDGVPFAVEYDDKTIELTAEATQPTN